MSASVLVTTLVLVIVAISLYRQHQQEKRYFSGGSRRQPATQPDAATLSPADQQAQLQAVREALAAHTLPCIRITPHPEKPDRPWQSRFGGKPYWPRAQPYPRTPAGEPLYMIAQLNLADVPALPGLPRQGLLQFFIADDDVMGLKFGATLEETIRLNSNGETSRVVYHPDVFDAPDQLDDDVPDCSQAEFMPLHDEYGVSFHSGEDVPGPTDHRFDHAVAHLTPLAEEVVETLWEEETSAGSKLGGYANFTQDDPRHSLVPGEWLLLFQLDTAAEAGVDIMWGDSGVGNWFIHRDDLARGDFSRVWFNWDCC